MPEDNNNKKVRQTDNRIDVRFPPDIYEAIKAVAEQDGAKIHHRSGEIILTPTIVRLVKAGLDSLSDIYPINLSDKISEDNPRVTAVEGEIVEIKKLLAELSVKLSDITIGQTKTVRVSKLPKDKNTPSQRLGNADEGITDSYSFREFHNWLGLPRADRNRVNGDKAIAIAKEKGLGGWRMDSTYYRFTRL
jgi:hypothetical protein